MGNCDFRGGCYIDYVIYYCNALGMALLLLIAFGSSWKHMVAGYSQDVSRSRKGVARNCRAGHGLESLIGPIKEDDGLMLCTSQ